jgi:hypothetical protein
VRKELGRLSPGGLESADRLGLELGGGDGTLLGPCPTYPFLTGNICHLTLAPVPPHQVLTPLLTSKEPALPADSNTASF